jgi:hypothetical protein
VFLCESWARSEVYLASCSEEVTKSGGDSRRGGGGGVLLLLPPSLNLTTQCQRAMVFKGELLVVKPCRCLCLRTALMRRMAPGQARREDQEVK